MCLLVGGGACGKTSLVRTLAALSGQSLVELALTSGTDTSDLLGGFEQLEPARQVQASNWAGIGGRISRSMLACTLTRPRLPSAGADG